jgi:alpha-L-fucosidase
MGWPEDGKLVVKSLAKGNPNLKKRISEVYLLGYGKLKARQTTDGLEVSLPAPCNKIAPVLRVRK